MRTEDFIIPVRFLGIFVFFFMLTTFACSPGDLTLQALIPRDSLYDRDDIDELRVQAFDQEGEEVFSTTSAGPENLIYRDVPEGTFSFIITASDSEGRDILQAETGLIRIKESRDETVIDIFLAPVEEISLLPESIEASEISTRCNLATIRTDDQSADYDILITGGAVGETPQSEAWIYEPRNLRFVQIPPMLCPRAGHSMAHVRGSQGQPLILIAGGGQAFCEGAHSERTTTFMMEVYDVSNQTFRFIDINWLDTSTPDLSNAVMSSLPNNFVYLTDGDSSWSIDFLNQEARRFKGGIFSEGAVQATSLTEDRGVALIGGIGTGSSLRLYDEHRVCGRSNRVNLSETGNAILGLDWGNVLVTSNENWWYIGTSQCSIDLGHSEGLLHPARSGHELALLRDGRVLISGGLTENGDETQTSFFLPRWSRGNQSSFMIDGPSSLHSGTGHRMEALPDGSALIIGCHAEPEIFNPHRGWQETIGSFETLSRPDGLDPMRVIFLVDSSTQGHAIREKAQEFSRSIASPEWGSDVVEVGVFSSELDVHNNVDGCYLPPDHLPEFVSPDGARDFVDPASAGRDLIAERIAWLNDDAQFPLRCEIQQPIRLSSMFLPDHEFGSPLESLVPSNAPMMLIILAGTDDSSLSSFCNDHISGDTFCISEYPFIEPACLEGEDMLNPCFFARHLLWRGPENQRFEVVYVWDDGNGETCPVPSRLQQFSDYFDSQHNSVSTIRDISACIKEPDELGQILLGNVKSLAFRQACVRNIETFGSNPDCQVFISYLDEQVRNVDMLQPVEHWMIESDGDGCEGSSMISIGSNYSVPESSVFERFEFVCR